MRAFKLFALAAAGATSLGLFASCEKFLDINQNPNAVLVAPASNLLVAAETSLGFLMGSDLHRYTSLIVQQFSGQGGSGIQTAEYDRYNITPTDINNVWRGAIFAGSLADMQKLIDQTQDSSPKYAGIAKITKAFLFSVTTDAFGDIPFTEALQFDKNFAPKYDASATVYAGIIALLNDGISDIKKSSILTPSNDDLIYGGDMAKWERMANTLKLRLYLHSFPKVNATSNADFAALLAAPASIFLRNNADNFLMRFEAIPNRNNPIDQFEKSRNNTFFPSATFVNLMNAKNDPRRPVYLTSLAAPSLPYVGAANGTGVTVVAANFSRMNTYLRGNVIPGGTGFNNFDGNAPVRMLTFAEYNLILAEYYARTGNLTLAQTSFAAGIRASMTDAGVSDEIATPNITTYIASRPVLTAANAIQSIVEEKFIANYGVAVEPWTDYRRTGFPTLIVPVNSSISAILRVLPYSDLERTSNPNTPARPNLTTPTVFWDR
ncbi:SusD/RagB family nutrient-binding outer membrane lipoprotein [Hymenobacter antarcticus]|uniref:SusD/RagB family nutrient-binding outer membrane lipoprotein n=1 Tax=Hymenobacter antarcticus TaxID=486270 RepID=A0ABP7QX76_9BACT